MHQSEVLALVRAILAQQLGDAGSAAHAVLGALPGVAPEALVAFRAAFADCKSEKGQKDLVKKLLVRALPPCMCPAASVPTPHANPPPTHPPTPTHPLQLSAAGRGGFAALTSWRGAGGLAVGEFKPNRSRAAAAAPGEAAAGEALQGEAYRALFG